VPPPTADFSANTKTGRIINGDFETGELAPWIGFEAAVSDTYSYKKDIYSVRLLSPASGTSSIQQTMDLTGVGSIYFWRHYFGGAGKYMEVLIDTTVIANYTETSTIPNDYESIDISSYGFLGLHTVTFRAVNTNPSGSFTVYLDNIVDYSPSTSGNASLTVQFKDLSSKMEDIAHTSWAWDFENDGTIDSKEQNPIFTYPTTGTYTVKLTSTNAGGSDVEIKPDFITVNQPPDTTAPASVTNMTNTTFAQTSITWTWTDPADSDFAKVMVYLDGVWKQNVTKGVQSWTATGLSPDNDYTIGTRTVDTTGNINATMVTDIARTAAVPDTTAPASVTNLTNTTFEQTSITWTWTDPADSDFEKVMVYLDGVWKQNVTKGVQSWTATGLSPDNDYTIGIRTVDTTGNINATMVTDIARTAAVPDTTAPASVTSLTNTTFAQTSITWTWTDPADSDFEKVMVYLDGVWKQNVTKGVQSWTATGLSPDTEYTIGTRTIDTVGNVNATTVTDVARTAPELPVDNTPPASVTSLANTTFAQTSITWTWTDPADSDFEKVMVYLDGVWKQNVTKGVQSWTATGLVADTEYTIGTRTIDTVGNVNATTVSSPARTAPELPADNTPPASVTSLANTTFAQTSITWTWTDPADSDFANVMVYLNGVWKQNVTKGVQSWTATELVADTEYTIGTKTVDTTGNINTTTVSDPARTAPLPPVDNTPPASVTNLANTTFAQTSITWTWTDPADSDFANVMVYLDGVWKQNVTKGVQSWTATELVADTEYTIGTKTVDVTGNVNATTVFDPAKTAPAGAPNAQFTASPRDGPAPLAVQFTDQSSGTISSRSWDFTNDGTVDSTLVNPVFTYTNPGNYTVNLTVRGPGGSDTEIKTGYISVKEPASGVSAQFTASPRAGSVPLTVRFTNQSSGEITSYTWDFNGDGIVDSRVKNPVTVYTSSGTFTVSLTVRGPDGMDTEVKTGYLSISGFLTRPNALFSVDKQFGSAPLTVHFTDKTLNNPDTFLWKFGDGATSAERNPSHTYLTPGFYKVSLTASNEAGSSSRAMYVFVSGF
jgi:PKD repeat protein